MKGLGYDMHSESGCALDVWKYWICLIYCQPDNRVSYFHGNQGSYNKDLWLKYIKALDHRVCFNFHI